MLTKRIIPCLDVNRGRVVKGINFVSLRDAGDPVEAGEAYSRAGADELVFLDITATSDARATVADMVRRVAERVFIPSRTSKAASRLSEQIRKNEFSKKYLAVVNGIIDKDEDTLVDYLKKEENGNTIVTNSIDGKISILNYKVLKRNYNKNETLVDIELKTGRHHQIRVQFASRNFPLCGDQRYGKIDKTQIALFAYHLEFYHPITKEKMVFNIEKPSRDYWLDF